MPYTNTAIARLFDDLADILEIKKDLVFKVRAYRRAAQIIRELPEPLEGLVRQGHRLESIPGIGQAIAKKIAELTATGRVATYEREKAALPEAFRLLVGLPGFSPKTAWRVVQETGVTSREELERAMAQLQLEPTCEKARYEKAAHGELVEPRAARPSTSSGRADIHALDDRNADLMKQVLEWLPATGEGSVETIRMGLRSGPAAVRR